MIVSRKSENLPSEVLAKEALWLFVDGGSSSRAVEKTKPHLSVALFVKSFSW